MTNNTNNKSINNIDSSSYNDSRSKESSSFNNPTRDLSATINKKPWYKKKGSIIAMSSTLGAGVIATAVAVPIILTSPTQSVSELTSVKTIYDLTAKTAKLVIGGKKLPDTKNSYKVFKETNAKALVEIQNITLKAISENEINLDFSDDTIKATSIYQVKLTNSSSSGSAITSKPTDRIEKPSFSITNQPTDQTILSSATTTAVTLSVTASAITNPISGEKLSYQWMSSDVQSTADETKWKPISGATSASYVYDAKDLVVDIKKYFKCTISYKYANSVTTSVVSVVRTSKSSINISAQPTSTDIAYSTGTSSHTLSVTAAVVNPANGKSLTYQWKESDSETGTFANITTNGTSNTYTIANVAVGSKKYYKCVITYDGATTVETNVVYVAKAAKPVITIGTQPTAVNLNHSQTTATLTVVATVANSTAGLTYQWQSAATQDGQFANIDSATSSTYSLTNIAVGSKYYKCIVSSTNAESVTSSVVAVTRAAQSIITIGTHPVAKTLTSASTDFSLTVAATATNMVSNQQLNYQWKSSSTQNGTYTNVAGATSATYTKTLEAATKKALRDTWYKCEVTYASGGATAVTSNAALVKMELTQGEAKTELHKWLGVDANAISVLTKYFNNPSTTDNPKHSFYGSLHDHRFAEGYPSVQVSSITPMSIVVEEGKYPVAYKSYKIRLKTTTEANISTKTTGGGTTRQVHPAGMIIEFNTLFSFGGQKVEFFNTDGTKYNMVLQPTFTTVNNNPITTLLWNSITGSSAPSDSNPIKKGNYPIKFYANDTTTTATITDSLFLPSRMVDVYTSGSKDYLYTMIPTYHIKATS
ncbi:MAG: hypothetical protein RSA40_03280 [Malacoplasma sp.]